MHDDGEGKSVTDTRLRAARRIVVFGNHGNGNLGDEATLQALIEQLRARLPEVEIVSFAMNPADTTARHRIRAEPATRLAAQAARARPPEPSKKDRLRAALRRVPALFGAVRVGVYVLRSIGRVLADPLFEVRRFQTLREADVLVFAGGGNSPST